MVAPDSLGPAKNRLLPSREFLMKEASDVLSDAEARGKQIRDAGTGHAGVIAALIQMDDREVEYSP